MQHHFHSIKAKDDVNLTLKFNDVEIELIYSSKAPDSTSLENRPFNNFREKKIILLAQNPNRPRQRPQMAQIKLVRTRSKSLLICKASIGALRKILSFWHFPVGEGWGQTLPFSTHLKLLLEPRLGSFDRFSNN